jgi:thioredoxin-related protein
MPRRSAFHVTFFDSIRAASASGRALVLALGTMLASILPTDQARAEMQLLMFEEPGCVWCMRWNEDVGGEYPITPEGQLAPLTRLQLRDPLPENVSLASRPRYTPTFVVLRDGTEIGRIEGYPGEDFFWGLLDRILQQEVPHG